MLDDGLAACLAHAMRDVHDFPKPGIVFKDITPILADGRLFADAVTAMAAPFRALGVTEVAGIESRGFIFGAPIALALGAGFVPIRKSGKLPARVVSREYALEYGIDRLEMHADACGPRSRVLVVDDVLATGGTAAAATALVEASGATVVGCSFLLAIDALQGTDRLEGRRLSIIVHA